MTCTESHRKKAAVEVVPVVSLDNGGFELKESWCPGPAEGEALVGGAFESAFSSSRGSGRMILPIFNRALNVGPSQRSWMEERLRSPDQGSAPTMSISWDIGTSAIVCTLCSIQSIFKMRISSFTCRYKTTVQMQVCLKWSSGSSRCRSASSTGSGSRESRARAVLTAGRRTTAHLIDTGPSAPGPALPAFLIVISQRKRHS
ncbi:hypothetical protein B0H34DRAFT_547948 [Crassisporium funariophilum]|nr:hypothetical protein B0H34DRAFT_547948 [Crassisporium funariophilum]